MKWCPKCDLEYRGALAKYCIECGALLMVPVEKVTSQPPKETEKDRLEQDGYTVSHAGMMAKRSYQGGESLRIKLPKKKVEG